MILIACSPQASACTPVTTRDVAQVEKRVEAIRVETQRIDAINDEPPSAPFRELARSLPHWEFSGRFHDSNPSFLTARFTEGQVVREESYYLHDAKLRLVRVETWWDVDDESQAPEPPTRQEYFVESDRIIRSVSEVSSSPPITRTDDSALPAASLVERSRSIVAILLGGAPDAARMDALAVFTGPRPSQR